MTTRIHIVNFGPDLVEVETPSATPVKIWPHDSANFYVYDKQTVTVKEVKTEIPNQA
jgi:ligand-binding SRPBCC domain-containing protein